jgi:homoserine acetyltransferase
VSATDLAARRNLTLVLDRPIADTKDKMIRNVPFAKPLIEWLHPAYLNYNNLNNLPKVKGEVLCIYSKYDKMVPFTEIERVTGALPDRAHLQLVEAEAEHDKLWCQEPKSIKSVDHFLQKIKGKNE